MTPPLHFDRPLLCTVISCRQPRRTSYDFPPVRPRPVSILPPVEAEQDLSRPAFSKRCQLSGLSCKRVESSNGFLLRLLLLPKAHGAYILLSFGNTPKMILIRSQMTHVMMLLFSFSLTCDCQPVHVIDQVDEEEHRDRDPLGGRDVVWAAAPMSGSDPSGDGLTVKGDVCEVEPVLFLFSHELLAGGMSRAAKAVPGFGGRGLDDLGLVGLCVRQLLCRHLDPLLVQVSLSLLDVLVPDEGDDVEMCLR